MSTDADVLKQIIVQSKTAEDPNATDAEYFEFFSAKHILRDYVLDPEEIKSGIIGQESVDSGGTDGGLDSIYLIVNGTLIRDSEQAKELSKLRQNIRFDVILIQSKGEKGFGLAAINRLNNTSETIFNIGKQPSEFEEGYNEALMDAISRFREAHNALLTKHANINVLFYYAGYGDSGNVNELIRAKATELEEKIPRLLATVTACKLDFVGARDMIHLFQRGRKSTRPLKCRCSISDNKGGWIALVELTEYFSFITENGVLREYLFESNVRNYEGDVEVNKDIRSTLEDTHGTAAFWWLNNGITVVATEIGGHQTELSLTEPRIVNGLQTSQEIFLHFSQRPPATSDKRLLMVRVIGSPDESLQDKIIKATNSQTKIPPQYLRASDDIQRDIELYFRSFGLHYERRKNSWRIADKSVKQVVGMTELAQSIASVICIEPDHARARPSRYFKNEFYDELFSGHDLSVYVNCALLRKRVEAYLVGVVPMKKDRNNVLFYMLALIGRSIQMKSLGKEITIGSMNVAALDETIISKAFDLVWKIYSKHGQNDTAAKGTLMVADLKELLKTKPLAGKRGKRARGNSEK